MIVTTGNEIAGRTISEYIGIVSGVVVRSQKSSLGFNLNEFATHCDESRFEASDRMIAHAAHFGADAIIGMRYDSAPYGSGPGGMTEIIAYGTAVKLSSPHR